MRGDRVGFIGVGTMGAPMVRRLLNSGLEVDVFDTDPARIQDVASAGANPAGSCAAIATRSRVVFVMVVNAEQAREALLGPQGWARSAPEGAYVVILSTIGPSAMRELASELHAVGLRVVDAPVSGGVTRAESGELLIMVGADDAAWDGCVGYLRLLGSSVTRCSNVAGGGQDVKLINQLICGVHIAVAAEALALAGSMGLDAGEVLRTIRSGAAASFMLDDRGPRMFEDLPAVRSSVDIFVKDLGLVQSEAQRLDYKAPISMSALEAFARAHDLGFGDADDSQVVKAYQAGEPQLEESRTW